MKLIIDISKNEYSDIIEQVKKCDYPDMGLGKIIANGTPYEESDLAYIEYSIKKLMKGGADMQGEERNEKRE